MRAANVAFAMIVALYFASIFSMSTMNALEASTASLPLIFAIGALLGLFLVSRANVGVPVLSGGEHLIAWLAAAVLSAPRIAYLFEQSFGVAVNAVCWDDWWRIQQLASLSYSPSYPPLSTFDSDLYLSFYYAPWMAGAVARVTGIVAGIKPAIFINHSLLILSVCYLAVFAGQVLFNDPKRRRAFLLLMFLFGGFDAFPAVASGLGALVKGGQVLPTSSEWWPTVFGLHMHFPDFTSLALWVPHHLAAAAALPLAAFIFFRSNGSYGSFLAGGIAAFALFSSAFAFIGAIPFLIIFLCMYSFRMRHLSIALASLIVFSLPLVWIYLRPDSAIGFKFFGALIGPLAEYKIAIALVFIIVLVLEFLPLWLLIFDRSRKPAGNRMDRLVLITAIAFLISTFFIAYGGTSNNYAGRGSILSIWALVYIAVRTSGDVLKERFASPVMRFVLLAYLFGSIFSYLAFSAQAVRSLQASFTPFNELVLRSNLSDARTTPADLIEQAEQTNFGWYMLEKFKDQPKPTMFLADKELMSGGNALRLSLPNLLD